MDNYIKEACIETVDEALAAIKAGADRVEFCSRLDLDGLTPDIQEVKKLLEVSEIPIMVMIRPRGGNFEYSYDELDQMQQEIREFKAIGIQGVVFGVLEGQCINEKDSKTLAELASPLEVCFHKAIDEVADPIKAVETLSNIPQFTRVLTSGQKPTADEGKSTLAKMMEVAGDQLSIMPAGKVTFENIGQLHKSLNAQEYHGRRIVKTIDT
ncbi:UNVERIFIED_CONTAM: hypothetical protein GTU68_028673 [Idotea baltica]|nr:hypothetical protein [Idotea baltica]